MDIVIIADFLGTLDGTYNSRFLYLADMLSTNNEVEILTSDFNHEKKKYIDYQIEKHEYFITMLHEGAYNKNVSIKRFYGHYIWGESVKKYLNKRKKPDVIYCAVPTLYASYIAAKYCKKNKVRFIIDIQDLWPEAFQMVFNIPIISNIVFSPFKYLCNGIYKRADKICAVSDTYCLRALRTNKKVKHTITVFLGTDLSVFDKNSKNNRVNKTEKKLWMGYCGSMGDSYDLKTVIDALALLDDPPLFIAMGDGEKKSKFEQYAKEKKVDCLFTGKLPYDQMCGWLGRCDMVVNPIVGNSVASIINKHADYAASGLPVLNTQNSNEYKKLVEEYNMGFNCESENPKELSEKINKLVIDKKLRTTMGENARRCAEERFDRKNTYDDLVKAILSEYMV